jgi:hypothetical protein
MSQHLPLLCLQTSILHEAFSLRSLGDRLSEAKYVASLDHSRRVPDNELPFQEKTWIKPFPAPIG